MKNEESEVHTNRNEVLKICILLHETVQLYTPQSTTFINDLPDLTHQGPVSWRPTTVK